MSKLKDIDYRILFELMKNSKTSDRKLAKKIGVSQPTVTRRRARLEREFIDGYSAFPKWAKLGYEIFAITLVKVRQEVASEEKYANVQKRGIDWLMRQPNIIMAGGCRGMGMDSFNLSFHKSYADYDEWMRKLKLEMADLIEEVQSILVNLRGTELLKPLHLKYLAQTK